MAELPEDWDCLHLGGYSNSGGLVNYSFRLNRSFATWGGYGYIVRKKAFKRLIETISQEQIQVDTYYTKLMPDMNWYKSKQMLVKHLAGYSTIEKKHRDIKELY